MQIAGDKFSYSQAPHAAPVKHRPKYRDESEENAMVAQNLMYDARVVRGNTYSTKPLSSSMKQEEPGSKKQPRKDGSRRKPMSKQRGSTPPPVDGRVHMVMQTEDFLEELTDRPIEQDAETQTQPFMDRPASPLFVRAKIGYDVSTQIEPGDLFDFNLEVEPILEVLVGKTLHVSMLEVMQEEELEAIRLQQLEFETIRNIELAEVQRLEAEIKRKEQEKQRRIVQEKKRLEEKHRLDELIAARQFSSQFLGELHVSVFDMLEEQGHFYDPVQREVQELFIPSLLTNMINGANVYDAAAIIAMELLEEARKLARSYGNECVVKREEMKARLAREEAERKRKEEERLAAEAAARAAAEAAEAEGSLEATEE
jgi:radial spoke head protein 3